MLRAGADALVEDVPVPELAVAAKVELTCADAADGHADLLKVRASIDRPFAALKERFHPFRAELLIRGDQPVEILARERPGHDRPPQHGQPGCRQREVLRKLRRLGSSSPASSQGSSGLVFIGYFSQQTLI